MKKSIFAITIMLLVASLTIMPVFAESAETIWTSENTTTVFEKTIIVPDNAAQYRAELKAKLTSEQAEAFEEGMVVIYVPGVYLPEDHDCIQLIACLPAELTADHQLRADFSGLYFADNDDEGENLQAQLITSRPIIMFRQEKINEGNASFSLLGVFYGKMDTMYDPISVSLDYESNTAQIDSVSLREALVGPNDGYITAYRYTYVVNEGEKMPYFLDMTPTDWTVWYEKKLESPRTIVMRPVKGAGCKVLFNVTNKDGTRYSLDPMDYD